jgi:hypothetical protein
MAIAGRILAVLGVGLLIFAVLCFLAAVGPRQGWDIFGPGFYVAAAVIFALPGAGVLLFGIHLVRQDREIREFNEAMERNDRWLRGIVCDKKGVPIPKATVDIYIEGSQGREPVASVRTGSGGRFATDLPEGQYLVVVSVPEVGESSLPLTVSNSEDSPELQIEVEATPS